MSLTGTPIRGGAPSIVNGIVTAVYPESGTMDVKVSFPDMRYYEDVPYASTFKDKGLAGIDFVPTSGCQVILLEHVSNETSGPVASPVVLGFRAALGKSLGSRTELLPSDVQVQGRYGNQLMLRSNGDAYLVGDHQNLLAFIVGEELTRLRTSNFEHETPGGAVTWAIDGDVDGGAVVYMHQLKRFASDPRPYLSITAGTAAGGGLDVTLFDYDGVFSSSSSQDPAFINMMETGCGFRFNVSSGGDVQVSARGGVNVEANGLIGLTSKTGIGLSAPQLSVAAGAGGPEISGAPGQPMRLYCPDGLEIEAPFIRITQESAGLVSSDNTEDSKQLLSVDLLEWLFTHVHMTYPTTLPTTPSATTGPIHVPQPDPAVDGLTTALDTAISGGLDPIAATPRAAMTANARYAITDTEDVITKETKAR